MRYYSLISVIYLLVILNKSNCLPEDLCNVLGNLTETEISAKCMKQLQIVCQKPEVLWKMFDASSKYPITGRTYSNGFDYGNFPECLAIDYEDPNEHIYGKYCYLGLFVVDILLPSDSPSRYEINSTIKETVKEMENVYKFNFMERAIYNKKETRASSPTISKLTLCVPNECTPKEVGDFFLYGHLSELNLLIYTGLPCETKYSNTELGGEDIAFLVFFGLILFIMAASTIYDNYIQTRKLKPKHSLLIAFSLLTNGQSLLRISKNTTEQIQIFNGMRFISMAWVIAFHGVAAYQGGIVGIVNWPAVEKWSDSWYNRYVLSALVAVDTFFYMAGFLVAYGYMKAEIETKPLDQIKKVPSMYFRRYLRLTPSAGMMFFVTVTIFRFLASGPMWSVIATGLKDLCERHWWHYFLYIQNYTVPDEMCINPMWYLSADMQLFILSPLVLIPTAIFIKKHFKLTMIGLVIVTILGTVIPMIIRYDSGEAGNIYTAHERFSDFLIGIIFGAFMRMKKQKPFVFSALQNFLLWIVTIVASLAFLIYWHDILTSYELVKYTLFMGLYRPLWCLCLSFWVYSCYHGYGGIVSWFLSRPIFQILGRLSYSMYVMHVIVEFYILGQVNTNTYFSDYTLFYLFCGHLIVTMLVGAFWVLAFEMPMLTVEKLIRNGFREGKPKPKSTS